MHFFETSLFYLVIGAGVGTAVAASRDRSLSGSDRLFRTAAAVMFWPLYLPFLLEGTNSATEGNATFVANHPRDALDTAIEQAERELDAALAGLDGWAEDVLGQHQLQMQELKAGWRAQAARLREMDRLLGPSEVSGAGESHAELTPRTDEPASETLRESERARQQNLERLRELRDQACHELFATLAKVRELVTMLHLSRFSGALPSRTQELVAQIAAAIEGLSEVSHWESGKRHMEYASTNDVHQVRELAMTHCIHEQTK